MTYLSAMKSAHINPLESGPFGLLCFWQDKNIVLVLSTPIKEAWLVCMRKGYVSCIMKRATVPSLAFFLQGEREFINQATAMSALQRVGTSSGPE